MKKTILNKLGYSLFTQKIPINETITIISNKIYKDGGFTRLSKTEFQKLYRIIVSAQFIKNLFMHVKNLYAKYSKDQNL